MTAEELIEVLEQLAPDTRVVYYEGEVTSYEYHAATNTTPAEVYLYNNRAESD